MFLDTNVKQSYPNKSDNYCCYASALYDRLSLLKQHANGTDIPYPVKQEIIIGLKYGGP